MAIEDAIIQSGQNADPLGNIFRNLLERRKADLDAKGKRTENEINAYALGRAQTQGTREDAAYDEQETAKALYPIISRATSAQTPQEARQVLATTSQLMGDRLDDDDRAMLSRIMQLDDARLGQGIQAINAHIERILGTSSTQDQPTVQSSIILENGNIGTVMRDGKVVDTGHKARGYANRPIETDAGVFNFDPGKGQISAAPLVDQGTLTQAAAGKAGAVTGAQETARTAAERTAAKPKATTSLSAAQSKVKMLTELIDQAGNQAGMFTTGFLGGQISKIPGTPAYDLSKTLDTIKANIGFDRLQEMRDSSPTGGALGQVSERENTLLQAVWGALEQSQSEKQFRQNLQRVKKQVKESWERVAAAYEQTYGEPMPEQAAAAEVGEGATPEAGGGWSIQEIK